MPHLQGENQIVRLRQTAEKLALRIYNVQDVAGVVFTGGLARGFMDEYSDIDIMVFLRKENNVTRKQIRQIDSEEQQLADVDMDVEVHTIEAYMKKKWNEIDRWSFSKADIVFDSNDVVKQLFDGKLIVSNEFWIRRIAVCGEYVKWYCCPFSEGVDTMAEAWIDRGDLLSAQYCLNYSLDAMLNIVFALNKEFVPPAKWKLFYSYNLRWLPANYKTLIEEILTTQTFSEGNFQRRLKALRTLWRGILPKIGKETGLKPDTISKYYVEKILRQG